MLPLLAIVGRPNVGKSTLFNRLLRRQAALVLDEPGVTRDRVYGQTTLEDRRLAVVDTGGLTVFGLGDEGAERTIGEEVFAQAREAVEEATAILLVMDGREGLTSLDEEVAAFIRQSGKPVLLAVNKVDGPEREDEQLAEFHALGFPLLGVSAAHGYHLPTLREMIPLELVPQEYEGGLEEDEAGFRLAVLGKPNAGKSSLVNALVGQDRLIVSDVAGTTRDAVDVTFERSGKRYTFVDTAGVRRRTNVQSGVERMSVLKALTASKRAQVTLLVLEAKGGVTMQDKKLINYLAREKLPFAAIVSKVDLVPKEERKEARSYFERELKITPHAPVIMTSSVTGAGLSQILPAAERIWEECQVRISTGELNRALRKAIEKHQPPMVKHRRAKFYYLTQVDVAPPTFIFFVNDPQLIRPNYARYLEGQLRKFFGFSYAPVQVVFRSSHHKDG